MILPLLFILWSALANAQSDCVGPPIYTKAFEFSPPLWKKSGEDIWQNLDGTSQIRLTMQPLKPDLTIKKYAKEYPENLKTENITLLSKKEIKVGPFDAFAIEGKLKTGSAVTKMKSITIFGNSTLYFFTLIAESDVYPESKACFDAVVQTLKEHPDSYLPQKLYRDSRQR